MRSDIIANKTTIFPTPIWELQRANFNINHTQIKKDSDANKLTSLVTSHIRDTYPFHLKVYKLYRWILS